ncbi:Seryl-tRNA synthetase [Spirochaeta thermophila DSM 6578]|uniref:Serine--tRNA ligase n=1 Tax=Winmispira thermophila (strain ATCC 700085 / DSM 6578 / Z-1203) TaxID=869211 RepID=G0GEA9_WINT7|nr:serine--tRNA ligase [Spirochaeta thermophila]AEJ62246.1 Seryl-tRNA synthetase [Spirochaeta thermophila DSM 6578]
MLDLRFVKEHVDLVKENVRNRFMEVDVEGVVALYDRRNDLKARVDELRARRNEHARLMKSASPEERPALVEEGRRLKEEIARLEGELAAVEEELRREALRIPNLSHPEAPVGKEEKDNLEIRRWGEVPSFDFEPRDHLELGRLLDIVDFDRAAKVSGAKFYYLKNEGTLLELALIRYALDVLREKGFDLFTTPDLARESIVEGIGFQPRGAESNIYTVEETDLCLVGTAEITLGGMYADEIIPGQALPLRFAGLSHCFRKEAGAAGQYSKGLYRVHQFTKVEMFVYCRPEESEGMHRELLAIEEEIHAGLGIPYRVVDTCTGDLGAPAYRKFDLEAWMPGREGWGEITSTSNCTDYQARRLGVRFKEAEGGKPRFVHMLNGTALAVPRVIIAILENFQERDGSVRIPEALVPYTGFDVIRPKAGS